jgi:PAS domain S-box-containing protein
MKKTIDILLLEDDPADAKLIQVKIEEADLAFRTTCVRTREEFDDALRLGRCDIILADYRLPKYDGMSALRLAQERCPEIPFIFVSGTMGEEVAIEALTQGATDYVLKHNLARLPAAVMRALTEAQTRLERKQAQEALQRSNEMLRAIIEAAPVAIIALDLDGRVQSVWNPAAEKMLGWSEQEVMGKPLPTVPASRQGEFKRFMEQLRRGMSLDGIDVRRQRRDGTPIDYSIYASPLCDAQGRISGNLAVLVDITERRRSSMINAARLRLMQFAATHSLDELLEEAINEAEKETDSLIGFYAFIDDDQQSLTLQNWSTRTKAQFCKAQVKGVHYPIADAGVWADSFHQRRPVIHNDYMSLPRRKVLPEGHAGIVRELVVPVMRGEQVKAVLGVGNKSTDYTEKDVEAMSLLADLIWEITERKLAEQQVAQMSFALNGTHEAAFIVDEHACFKYVNEETCRILGYSRDELFAMTVPDISPEYSVAHWPGRWSNLKEQGASTIERQITTRDGRVVPVEINASYFEYEGRGYMLGLARDITERKQAERERLANLRFFECMDRVNRAIQGTANLEAMMRDLLDVVLSIFDCDRAFLMYPCDPEAPTLYCPMERNKPEYTGIRELGGEHPVDPQVAAALRVLLAADGPATFGPGMQHALPEDVSEQYGIKSVMSMAIYPKTGSPWQFGIQQCASARIWTVEEMRMFEAVGRRLTDGLTSLLSYRDLRQSEEFLDNVVEHVPNMLFVKDTRDLRFVRFNKAGEQLLGWAREELLGKTDHDFFPKEMADFFTDKDRQVLDTGALVDIAEETIRNRGNEKRILHTKKIPILDETGTPQYLLGISEDITEHKQAQESIRKLSQAIEQSPVSIVITDVEGNIEFVNAAFAQITGYTFAEALGQNPRILKSGETPAEEYHRLWQTISSGGVWQGEFHNRKKNGELFWEHATIAPVRDADNAITHYVAVKEDITERKKLEAQLRQVQKLEAIGLLAGGIAHDFNNILSAITGYTEISQSIVEPESEVAEYLAHVLEAGWRAKELINQILMFSRETEQELRPIRLALPVKEALKLIRASVPATIEIHTEILSQASALADPTQVHQIVMNLCTNATHAMKETGGLLQVHLTDITIDHGDHHKTYPDAAPGEYIRLTVSDQGHGIDAFHLERIFDPFFTTKEKGEGSGMGLSVVHGIVKSYGGMIYVHSRPGEGGTFEILIPALESALPDKIAIQKPVPTGSESILFVDDEEMIADIVKGMLETLGYRVAVRTSPIEALEAFRDHPDGFDLMVTDLIMPKMSGLELAEKILQIRPDLPIVLCTGFGVNMDEEQIVRRGVRHVIFKPILRRDMATAVRNALDGADDGPIILQR